MYPFNFNIQKQRKTSASVFEMPYLVARSESKEIAAAGRGTFGVRTRYLAKYRMLRTLRRLRQNLA